MLDNNSNNKSIRLAKILSISCVDRAKTTSETEDNYRCKLVLYIEFEEFIGIKHIFDENNNHYKLLKPRANVIRDKKNAAGYKKNNNSSKLVSFWLDFTISFSHLSAGNSDQEHPHEKLGKNLYAKQHDLPKLAKDIYYYDDLIGLSLYFDKDKIGEVVSVANFGASDLLLIELGYDFDYKSYSDGINKISSKQASEPNDLKLKKESIYLPFDDDMFLKVDNIEKKIYLKSLNLLTSYLHFK